MIQLVLLWVLRAVGLVLLLICVLHFWQGRWGTVPPHPATGLRAASFNVHYIILFRETGPWSVGNWEERKGAMDAAFKALDADLVAFQEMESFRRGDGSQNLVRDWLIANNPDYALAAHPDAAQGGDWQSFPITQPILYRREALTLRDQGWFFFSETPDVIYSRTFNGSWPAYATWAEFETPQGQVFRAVNVHFDFSSASNRAQSADLTRARIAPWIEDGMPVILLGDLNVLHGMGAMRTLEKAGLRFANTPGTTYHLNQGLNLLPAIDHIGATPNIGFEGGPYVLRGRMDGDWPSDHYPVVLDLSLP